MKDQSSLPTDLSFEDAVIVRRVPGVFLHRFLRVWLRFSGPKRDHFRGSLADQERLRRSRILSVLFLLVMVTLLLVVPTAIPVPTYWIPILSLVLLSVLALLFNRVGRITLSGSLLVLGIDLTLTILMVTLPQGIRNSNIPDFDLFLLVTLIGGIVLPRRFLPFLAAFHLLLIVALFALLPHDPLLTQEIQINQQGFAYSELSDALVLQVVGAAIAWLNAWSVDRALLRVSRAEELARAHQRLNEYMQAQVKLRERLEYGIQVLRDAHARFANGDYKARALLQDNELASLAASFNLLAERLNRIAQTALEYTRLEQGLQQLVSLRDAMMHQNMVPSFTLTGTMVDQLYPWLKQSYQIRRVLSRQGEGLEKVRQALTRQRTLAIQLGSALDRTHSEVQIWVKDPRGVALMFESVEKAHHLCQQIEEQGTSCFHEARQLEQLLKGSP